MGLSRSLPSRVLPWCRRGRRTRRRILVLIIPLYCPQKLAKKAPFLFVVLITFGRRGRPPHPRGRGRPLGCLPGKLKHRRVGPRLRSRPEDLLEEIPLVPGGHFAVLIWLGARYKGSFVVVWAHRSG